MDEARSLHDLTSSHPSSTGHTGVATDMATLVDVRTVVIVAVVVSSVLLLILVISTTLVFCCLRRARLRKERESHWTKDIFVTNDIHHIPKANVLNKSATNKTFFERADPLEFPRNKLVFLNSVLGKSSNLLPFLLWFP